MVNKEGVGGRTEGSWDASGTTKEHDTQHQVCFMSNPSTIFLLHKSLTAGTGKTADISTFDSFDNYFTATAGSPLLLSNITPGAVWRREWKKIRVTKEKESNHKKFP